MTQQSTFELSELTLVTGFTINGISIEDSAGYSVSNAGDVNGDGLDDVIIGAYGVDLNGNNRVGQAYVVFGSQTFTRSIELSNLDGSNGFIINGIAENDNLARTVSYAGDVNADGYDDIIIGSTGADPHGRGQAGQAYIIFGKSNFAASLNLSELNGTNGVAINGIKSGDNAGHKVSSAGDVNGDGFDDVIISALFADPNGRNAAGQVYVVFGRNDFAVNNPLELGSLNGNNGIIINGINMGDGLGNSLSSAGDINGDGFDDIVISAPTADPNGKEDAGQVYMIFGGRDFADNHLLELDSLNGNNGVIINGVSAGDRIGNAVSNAGDLNGDGFDDVIIGAPQLYNNTGQVYLILGRNNFASSFDLSEINDSDGVVINGIAEGDWTGEAVSYAGDVNNDGYDDIIIGAYQASPNAKDTAGRVYIFYGKSNFTNPYELSELNNVSGITFNGIDVNDFTGFSVSNAGDVNGDGFTDVIIGAFSANPHGKERAGQAYVVYANALAKMFNPTTTSSITTAPITTTTDADNFSTTVSASIDISTTEISSSSEQMEDTEAISFRTSALIGTAFGGLVVGGAIVAVLMSKYYGHRKVTVHDGNNEVSLDTNNDSANYHSPNPVYITGVLENENNV